MHALQLTVTSAWRTALVCAVVGAALGCSGGPGENIGDNGAAVSSSSVSGATIASLAKANLGLGACSKNSEGGTAFETSCDGNGGEPEYWCADFAQWVWQQAGADTTGLDAAAGSFYVYGQNHGTLHSSPSLGDVVVFNYAGGGYADHVAIVVQVNSNGTIETVSGDWAGSGGSEAAFSSTSRAVLNSPAYAGVVGGHPGIIGMTISGFVSPAGGGSAAGPAPTPSCIVSTTGEAGTCTDTATCASQGGTSTAGYCGGAANIQCCTGVASGSSSDQGSGSGSGSASPASGSGSTTPASGSDAGSAGTGTGSGTGTGESASACTVSSTGEMGTCMDTSDCSAQGGTSTADYCPGAASVQCCTGIGSSSGSSASSSEPAPTAAGCYSDTLGKEMPANACVQSEGTGDWWQCDNGSWVDRWDDATPCDGVYPL